MNYQTIFSSRRSLPQVVAGFAKFVEETLLAAADGSVSGKCFRRLKNTSPYFQLLILHLLSAE